MHAYTVELPWLQVVLPLHHELFARLHRIHLLVIFSWKRIKGNLIEQENFYLLHCLEHLIWWWIMLCYWSLLHMQQLAMIWMVVFLNNKFTVILCDVHTRTLVHNLQYVDVVGALFLRYSGHVINSCMSGTGGCVPRQNMEHFITAWFSACT